MKEKCALEALAFIKNGMVIGLGGGRTIKYLAQFISERESNVTIVTPSFETEKICVSLGLHLVPLCMVSHIDVAFDGCDEVDENFFALKSGGGIHTKEKLIANIADDYVLLIDDSKLFKTLAFKVPIVIELLEDSLAYVENKMIAMGARFELRTSSGKYGPLKSDYGNVLADVYFKNIGDIKKLNHDLKKIAGVIDTSLLTKEVTKIVVVSQSDTRLIVR